jgi:hypothetical protein
LLDDSDKRDDEGAVKRALPGGFIIVALLGTSWWVTDRDVDASRSAPVVERLTSEVYVWQRVWGDKVGAAVERCLIEKRPVVDGVCVLAGELGWRDDVAVVVRPSVNWSKLKTGRSRVSLAWRIPLFRGREVWDDRVDELVRKDVEEMLDLARREGVEVAEVQVDFDCPTRRLAEYAKRIRSLKREFVEVRWVVTALPTWLDKAGMNDLAEAADGLVLQVHWLHRGLDGSGEGRLVDEGSAQRAVRRCARLKVPFRVALPTYGNGVVMDESGAWMDVLAEESRPVPVESKLQEVRSDPALMVDLIKSWQAEKIDYLTGIFWYRLPVEGELRNWKWETLVAVMNGRVPTAEFEVVVEKMDEGFAEVHLVNTGDADGTAPLRIYAMTAMNDLVGDGVNGYVMEETDQGIGWVSKTPRMLGAGKRFSIGWFRLGAPEQVPSSVVFQLEP